MKRYKLTMIITVIAVIITSCNQPVKQEAAVSKRMDSGKILPKGDRINSKNFIGTVWLNSLIEADSINQNAVGSVTFEPGARTNWHSHPKGQIILALGGEGYYQEVGSPKILLHKGDIVKCPADVPHWHGASSDKEFIQVAITGRDNGPTKWLERVTDEEYNK